MKPAIYFSQKAIEFFRSNYQALLIVSGIIALISLIFDGLVLLFPSTLSGPFVSLLLVAIRLLLLTLFNIALYRICHDLVVNSKSDGLYSVIRESKSRYKNYLVLTIMLFVIVCAGLILLVIPGIIFAVWYFSAGYIAAKEEVRPLVALDRSRRMVEGRFFVVFWRLLVALLVFPLPLIVLLSLLSTIPFSTVLATITGLLVNFILVFLISPFIYLVIALIYEDLKE